MILRIAPVLVLSVMVLPVGAGLLGTIGPALRPGAVDALLAWPGLARAMSLSFATGLASTVLALVVVVLILATLSDSRAFAALCRLLSPLLALPHAAAALGLAFLIAPSGWIARALSPWATGWTTPPDALILNDPLGLSLTLGLVAKEVPFLLLMALAALPQTDAPARKLLAASLGYGRATGFVFTILPALYPLLRLPCLAVLAYGMTTVEMGMILGPGLPPPLSVQISLWSAQADLATRPLAAAGALVQLMLVAAAMGVWLLAERATIHLLRCAALSGIRARFLDAPLAALALTFGAGLGSALALGLAGLTLWSFAGLWSFPDLLPQTLSFTTWQRAATGLTATTLTTLALALASASVALALVFVLLEAEARQGHRLGLPAQAIVWLPLLMPQIALLPGLQLLTLQLGAGGAAAVFAGHLVFVLPYVFLSLSAPFRAIDPRLATLAASLGASPNRRFWQVRLPLLLRPALTALAVGLAVSVGQYLPTLLLGGGRVTTLTTEAVALSSGGNRRLIGAYALLQMLLPTAGFALAILVPALVFRHRKAMQR